jgi:hypothetical protein
LPAPDPGEEGRAPTQVTRGRRFGPDVGAKTDHLSLDFAREAGAGQGEVRSIDAFEGAHARVEGIDACRGLARSMFGTKTIRARVGT